MREALAELGRHRRDASVNAQGGDAGQHASGTLLVRHTVNHVVAAQVMSGIDRPGPLLDVGSGVGAFSWWLARHLGRPLHLVDHDAGVRDLAARAFPEATVHADLASAPSAPVVTAMEVIEHVDPGEQHDFVRGLVERVTPGGVLVCSTPDESGYLGGWSGYAPHIGTLDFGGFWQLLTTSTGLPATVWRIDGPGFVLSPSARVLQPLANRLWTAAQRFSSTGAERATALLGRLGRRRPPPAAPRADAYRLTRDPTGQGTGLIGVVHRPD